jgi:hypothetical protein
MRRRDSRRDWKETKGKKERERDRGKDKERGRTEREEIECRSMERQKGGT